MNVAANRRRRSLWPLWAVALTAAAVAVFLGITSIQIVRQAGLQEIHPSDAIVVFGAAQYAGHPSPFSAPGWTTPTICSSAASRRWSSPPADQEMIPLSAKAAWDTTT